MEMQAPEAARGVRGAVYDLLNPFTAGFLPVKGEQKEKD